MVEFPVMVGDALKMNVFDLACTEADSRQVLFEQQIQVSTVDAESDEDTMRRYLAEQAKFNLMERVSNGDCKIIGQGTIRLSALISSLRSTGSLRLQLFKPAAVPTWMCPAASSTSAITVSLINPSFFVSARNPPSR